MYAPATCTSPINESAGIMIASAILFAIVAGFCLYVDANPNDNDDARSACADSSIRRSSAEYSVESNASARTVSTSSLNLRNIVSSATICVVCVVCGS